MDKLNSHLYQCALFILIRECAAIERYFSSVGAFDVSGAVRNLALLLRKHLKKGKTFSFRDETVAFLSSNRELAKSLIYETIEALDSVQNLLDYPYKVEFFIGSFIQRVNCLEEYYSNDIAKEDELPLLTDKEWGDIMSAILPA